LYEIQQQQIKLQQTFPPEHSSSHEVTAILQLNPNTLITASTSVSSSSYSDNVIVVWSKPKSSQSSGFKPIQRVTQKETGHSISKLEVLNKAKEGEEAAFASCASNDHSIIIWRRGKGGEGEDRFRIKQRIKVMNVSRLLYISLTNELISGSHSSLLQIWSSSSTSSTSDLVEKQKIQTPSWVYSLCQINETRNNDSKRIEFASGHKNGHIMIWSNQQQKDRSNYFSIRTLKPFNHFISDLITINDVDLKFLISCSFSENKIVIYNLEEEEKEELEHRELTSLIPMSNGLFASGGTNQCLNIWSPSSSIITSF
jgi:hypothetical protein